MKPSSRISLRLAPRLANSPVCLRPIHSSVARSANVSSVLGAGPPPEPPMAASAHNAMERVARRKKQAEMLKTAKELRKSDKNTGSSLKRRFWKGVAVEEVDGMFQVHLDQRPLRHPETKKVIRIPISKPDLASALALEWDLLNSSLDATRHHLIPLTSLICRARDIEANDASDIPETEKIRAKIATVVLRYLDTDSILCWAPPPGVHDTRNAAGEGLRDVQKKVAEEMTSFLTTHVWPGVQLDPVLDGHSIVPQKQAPGVREIVQGWVLGLDAWEITGLERAVLAGKSLLAAARFVTEWSEGSAAKGYLNTGKKFGVEDAAVATSLEVDWQTGQWGEVEDTHDVQKEDVRRQLGSVALLVSGTGSKA